MNSTKKKRKQTNEKVKGKKKGAVSFFSYLLIFASSPVKGFGSQYGLLWTEITEDKKQIKIPHHHLAYAMSLRNPLELRRIHQNTLQRLRSDPEEQFVFLLYSFLLAVSVFVWTQLTLYVGYHIFAKYREECGK